jgi:hypothetical protein
MKRWGMGKIRTVLSFGQRSDTLFYRIYPYLAALLTMPPLHKPVFCGRFVPVSKENVEYAADTNGGFKAAVCKD